MDNRADTTDQTNEDSKVTVPLSDHQPADDQTTEETQTTAHTATGKPSAILVKIERVAPEHAKTPQEKDAIGKLLANGPIGQLPYEDGSPSTAHWPFPIDQNTFEVPAIVADAAVASGFFRAV